MTEHGSGEARSEERTYTVSEVTAAVKHILEESLPAVWVEGEISNLNRHTSGHMYFTLKDEKSQLSAVMFRHANSRLSFTPQSGMKVLANGGLNLSVLDGWWAEGYREGVGWAIGRGEEYEDFEYQDRVEAQALYSILEQEAVPLFYDRGADGLPHGWIAMMKQSMRILSPVFASTRMVKEYAERYYLPALAQYRRMEADDYRLAREIAQWKQRIIAAWKDVAVVAVGEGGGKSLVVGDELALEARIRLGSLSSEDVRVEIYHGLLTPEATITGGHSVCMERVAAEGDLQVYRGAIPSTVSGQHAYAVRVLPSHDDVLVPNEIALVAWE